MSDIILGINDETIEFLNKMAPGVPNHLLRYVSPEQPKNQSQRKEFHERKDYIFFGYNNYSNKAGLDWFLRKVLPYISKEHIFRILGNVAVSSSFCICSDNIEGKKGGFTRGMNNVSPGCS